MEEVYSNKEVKRKTFDSFFFPPDIFVKLCQIINVIQYKIQLRYSKYLIQARKNICTSLVIPFGLMSC